MRSFEQSSEHVPTQEGSFPHNNWDHVTMVPLQYCLCALAATRRLHHRSVQK